MTDHDGGEGGDKNWRFSHDVICERPLKATDIVYNDTNMALNTMKATSHNSLYSTVRPRLPAVFEAKICYAQLI